MTGHGDLGAAAVRLRLPANPDQLGTVRLFGAASARQFGADDEVAEDLRLAVSEACAMILQSAGDPAALVVTLTPAPTGIEAAIVSVTGDDEGDAPAALRPDGADRPAPERRPEHGPRPLADDEADSWGAELLGAIVSGLSIDRKPDGRSTVTFTLPLDGPAPDGADSGTR
jgi:anti-sigma regulatory factor (Ser/Thr protein kinase)